MTKQELLDAWAKEVYNRSEEIDPHDEHDWYSMFVGFAIGKGMSIEEATDYSLYKDHRAFIR